MGLASGENASSLAGWRVATTGFFCVLPTCYFAVQFFYEKTFLSWEYGPQMVGFVLMHTWLGWLFYLSIGLSLIWLAWVCWKLFRNQFRTTKTIWLIFAVGLFSLPVLFTPDPLWHRLFEKQYASSRFAADFAAIAAARGEVDTLRGLLDRGVSPNARDAFGATPLHAAAVNGSVACIELLFSRGADPNVLNAQGTSPLANAISMNRGEAVALIRARGGTN